MTSVSTENQILKSTLVRALERDQFREFQVYYQPVVDINTGEIIAAESLLRWQSPELGEVSNAELIPLAETTGLIVELGDWVLQTVCKQAKVWHEAGFPLKHVSVNLSAPQFIHPDFGQKTLDCLEIYDLEPHYLEMEFNENTIMQEVDNSIASIQKLQNYGFKVAINDFGAGYSSLTSLQRLPLTALKIDRHFIQNVHTDLQKSAVTTALIKMAHNLNFKVVAKGVEAIAELAWLRQEGCDAIQGFIFSRPLPATDFERLLLSGKRLIG